MINNATTDDVQIDADGFDVSASNSWSESYVRRLEASKIGRFGQIAGVALALAVYPTTAIPDIWVLRGRGSDPSTVVWEFKVLVGKPISRSEALVIARRALDRAERERTELAEWEAKRGLQWGDGA